MNPDKTNLSNFKIYNDELYKYFDKPIIQDSCGYWYPCGSTVRIDGTVYHTGTVKKMIEDKRELAGLVEHTALIK